MHFTETPLSGAFVITAEPAVDDRGSFARTYCMEEFARRNLVTEWVQCNASFNRRTGTVRGLHFQIEPHAETKLVRCTRGAVFDVAVDIRADSPTFKRWFAVELTADNYRMLYIPAGCAHGFQTLVDDCELFYQMSASYHPECARGLRWDDDEIGIDWPLRGAILSGRDKNCKPLSKLCCADFGVRRNI